MNNKGLILIELIVATVILGIIALIIVSMTSVNKKSTDINASLKRTRKVRCIGGFKFISSNGGKTEQVLNEHGSGVKCD
jgi:hypothetical protein